MTRYGAIKFYEWLKENKPGVVLSYTQIKMVENIFTQKRYKFARQLGKSTVISLVNEFHADLLGDSCRPTKIVRGKLSIFSCLDGSMK